MFSRELGSRKKKMLRRISESYKKSPQFDSVFPLIEDCILHKENNLFQFIYYSIMQLKNYFEINAQLVISSTVPVDHLLKSEKKVLQICKALNAGTYINPIGGTALYSVQNFSEQSIGLNFLQSGEIKYTQFGNEFVPWLSIIDVMMFNPKEKIKEYLNSCYSLI